VSAESKVKPDYVVEAESRFFKAREHYTKVKANLQNPSYGLDVHEAEEAMRQAFTDMNRAREDAKREEEECENFNVQGLLSQLARNAFHHKDPNVRANCFAALSYASEQLLSDKVRRAINLVADANLKILGFDSLPVKEKLNLATYQEFIIDSVEKDFRPKNPTCNDTQLLFLATVHFLELNPDFSLEG
jgi:hypothetical protein